MITLHKSDQMTFLQYCPALLCNTDMMMCVLYVQCTSHIAQSIHIVQSIVQIQLQCSLSVHHTVRRAPMICMIWALHRMQHQLNFCTIPAHISMHGWILSWNENLLTSWGIIYDPDNPGIICKSTQIKDFEDLRFTWFSRSAILEIVIAEGDWWKRIGVLVNQIAPTNQTARYHQPIRVINQKEKS